MKSLVFKTLKLIIWLIVMLFVLRFTVFSSNNSFALQPDWFSGDKNDCGNGCYTLVLYSNIGFPIQIDGSSTGGPYWLAWTINIATAATAGIIIAIILYKLRFKKS